MKELPNKYKYIIKEKEKVIWHDKPSGLLSSPLKISLLLIIAILVIIVFYLLGGSSKTFIPIVFLGWGIFAVASSVFSDLSYYIATDKGIYIKPVIGAVIRYNYSRIHAFGIENEDIVIYSDTSAKNVSEDEVKHLPRLSYVRGKKMVKRIIEEYWFPQSPYQMINNELKVLAKKYDLKITPFEPFRSQHAELKGEINNLPVLVKINDLKAIEKITIAIDCPNTENNYIRITEESAITMYKKIFGLQDLKVGNPKVDNVFLFQSDHSSFFDYIMTDEVQHNLLEAWQSISGMIEMGDSKNIKKKTAFSLKKKKIDNNILDDDFIENLSNVKEKAEGLTSTLVYHSNELDSLSNNMFTMTKNINVIFETVLGIALKIKEYNKA